jgi:GT2 family glycosyltransferase
MGMNGSADTGSLATRMRTTRAAPPVTRTPSVSVVLLSALRWNLTERCLQSIYAHTTGQDLEIVVVDMGGSSEAAGGLASHAARDGRVRLVMNDRNVGTSRGRNQGLAECAGEFVVFLDNDAVVRPGWLHALLRAAAVDDGIGLYGGKLVCSNGRVYFCNRYIHDVVRDGHRYVGVNVTVPYCRDDPEVNVREVVPWYPTGCLMGRRRDLLAIAGFDEGLPFVEEDKDLSLRMRAYGKQVLYVPECEVLHDRGQDAVYDATIRFRNAARMERNVRDFERKWGCSVELIYSRTCLESLGYAPELIEDMVSGPLRDLFTVVDAT